jgi:hypothetical protein
VGITKDGRGRPSRAFILSQVDLGMTDLARTGGLPTPDENEEIWRNIWFEEAHNSTAIEGNTLVLKQVRTLLEEGRTVGSKELCEYLDVEGYARAAQWVYGQGRSNEGWHDDTVTRTELREIHRLAVGLAWEVCPPDDPPLDANERAGNFRRHDIKPFPEGMTPPPWPEVEARLTDWLKIANDQPPKGEHVLTHLARAHNALERPGLTARALRAAAIKGRLKSRRDDGGRWLSTRRWVDEYVAARRMGRPKAPSSSSR